MTGSRIVIATSIGYTSIEPLCVVRYFSLKTSFEKASELFTSPKSCA